MSKATRRIHKTHLLPRRRRTSSNDVSSRRQLSLRSAIKNQPNNRQCVFRAAPARIAPVTIGSIRHPSTILRVHPRRQTNFQIYNTSRVHLVFSRATRARTGVENCRVMSANGGREGVHGVLTPLSRLFPFTTPFEPLTTTSVVAFGSTFSLSKSANSNWARNDVRSSRVGVYVPRRRPSASRRPSTLVATSMTRDDRSGGGGERGSAIVTTTTTTTTTTTAVVGHLWICVF